MPNLFSFGKLATVLRLEGKMNVIVWWDGKLHNDLVTFDDAGFKLMYDSFSIDGQLQVDVTRANIKLFLNDLLASTKYDFTVHGPVHLDETRVKTLLGIK
jgi:hypothetical protein